MKNIKKLTRKMNKLRALENGREQFAPLIRPTAYVFVNNVSLAVTR